MIDMEEGDALLKTNLSKEKPVEHAGKERPISRSMKNMNGSMEVSRATDTLPTSFLFLKAN